MNIIALFQNIHNIITTKKPRIYEVYGACLMLNFVGGYGIWMKNIFEWFHGQKWFDVPTFTQKIY